MAEKKTVKKDTEKKEELKEKKARLESVMPRVWIDRVWEMIWKRWKYYESFCNKR